jgi:glycosyltransferase involved in cell wall biosynthesis
MNPKCSVIVCTSPGREANLRGCLTLLAQQQTDFPFEVVVADDGSTGAEAVCADFASLLSLRYVWRPNDRCVSRSRNLGVRHAQGEMLVFVDSDVLLCPGGLAAYAQVMPQGGLWYGYFGSHQRDWRASSLLLPRAQIQWADPRFLDDQGHLYPQPRLLTSPHENAWSGNFALQRRDYYALQGFDEDFVGWGGEDLDFAWRACQAGYPIHFTLEAWGEHQPHPLSEPFHLLPRGKIYPFPTHRAPAQAVRCVCSPLAAQAWEQRLYYYQQDLIRDNFGL